MRKRNQYEGVCKRCGIAVAAGAGWVDTRRNQETLTVEYVVEHETCPTETAKPDERHEMPLWGEYCRGTTLMGNETDGVMLIRGDAPDNAVPLNDAAKRMQAENDG